MDANAVEQEFGGRDGAAAALNVSRNVFDKLGKLSGVDDPQEGRKVGGQQRSLTADEATWVRNALAGLTIRVGEASAAGESPLARLTVADFRSGVHLTSLSLP